MYRCILRVVSVTALLLVATACGNSDDDLPTTPGQTPVTEPFSGTLTLNGAKTHNFAVTASGAITGQLTALEPNNPVGLLLGTWNGSICQHVPGLSNDNATQGSVVNGFTDRTGDFCVRIYDANGTIVQPQAYTIEVSYFTASQ